jgi:hypothetical protein
LNTFTATSCKSEQGVIFPGTFQDLIIQSTATDQDWQNQVTQALTMKHHVFGLSAASRYDIHHYLTLQLVAGQKPH